MRRRAASIVEKALRKDPAESYDRHVNVALGWGTSLASEKPAER